MALGETRFRVWFYFSIRNVRVGQKVLLNITNFCKTKSLYREGMGPVVRSSSRKQWYVPQWGSGYCLLCEAVVVVVMVMGAEPCSSTRRYRCPIRLTVCSLHTRTHICRERLPAKQVYYYKSPRHKKNYILSFLFTFDREDDTYFFAYSYPYTYASPPLLLWCGWY